MNLNRCENCIFDHVFSEIVNFKESRKCTQYFLHAQKKLRVKVPGRIASSVIFLHPSIHFVLTRMNFFLQCPLCMSVSFLLKPLNFGPLCPLLVCLFFLSPPCTIGIGLCVTSADCKILLSLSVEEEEEDEDKTGQEARQDRLNEN